MGGSYLLIFKKERVGTEGREATEFFKCVQHKQNSMLGIRGKVLTSSAGSLWGAGGADRGAGGVRAAVVTDRACPGAAAAPPLQHAGVEVGVAPGVLGQVVAAHEAFLTQRAAELLLSGVSAVVPGQLIRASELLVTALPVAFKRPLTCMGP